MARSIALNVIGALAIVALSFFSTLFVLDLYSTERVLNGVRASDVARLKEAIERYRKERGKYPALPGNPVDDLRKDLVEGGYLKEIPSDPLRSSTGFQYQYVSDGVKLYGFLVVLKEEQSLMGKKPGGLCVTGVGIKGSGAWGDPPECQF